MCPEIGSVVETPVATSPAAKPAKAAKSKKPAKKAAKPAKAQSNSKAKADHGVNKTQLAALKLLAKGKPLTRAQISEKLDGAFIGGKVMGHADDKLRTKTSLVGRGMARFAPRQNDEDREDICYYEITAAGHKALAK